MIKRSKKIFLFSFLALLAFALTAGFYLYNKGPLDVRNSTSIAVNADELYTLYTSDSVKAGKKFTSKVLLVQGEISEVSTNLKNEQIILVKTGTPGAYVNCTLQETAENLVPGAQVSIKGICSGIGEGDPGLGLPGDVYLTRCIVSNK
jgi:hypothetical protein